MRKLVRLAIVAATILAMASPAFGEPEPPVSSGSQPGSPLPVQIDAKRMTVLVDIGPHGPFDFLIDTGAETTVISERVARHLDLQSDGTVRVLSIGGQADRDSVWLDGMTLGTLQIDRRRAIVMDETAIGAAGIIGIDSLKDQRVVLDFDRGTVSVSRSRSLLERDGHDLLLDAGKRGARLVIHDATVDGIPVDLIVDTGLDVTIGNVALRDRLDARTGDKTTTTITDANGHLVNSRLKVVRVLQVDRLRLIKPLVAFVDSPVFERLGMVDRPAILLGMNHLRMFRSVAVDFRRRQIAFDLHRKGG
ncbi:aspartyl protease family protein [Croceicoccus sp. BE223]|uniref:aspartyl protease family protein n=1 Tax=Croceicoccus sp. BE223 TaxID=2817716 RepID=UPI002859AD79|nr:aspartyl protease family protein [Croceicoccus sp. BE223]MDR7103814.1 putative aspartyl protease [Croceicoccus sp. BE223]